MPDMYKRGPTKYQDGESKGHWTKAEDQLLEKAVDANKGKGWKKIAEWLPNRSDVQCLHRWQKVLNPNLVKGKWFYEEDLIIFKRVYEEGAQKWTDVAHWLPGRIGKQCRERWHNHLSPWIKKGSWSHEEDLVLFLLNRQMTNKWAEFAEKLDYRPDNQIKNHWNSTMKNKKNFAIETEIEKEYQKYCEENNETTSREQFYEEFLKEVFEIVNEQNEIYISQLIIQRRKQYIEQKKHSILDELSLYKAMIMAQEIDMSLDEFLTPTEQVRGSEVKAKP